MEARGVEVALNTMAAGQMGRATVPTEGSGDIKPAEGDDLGGPVLGRKASMAWADFGKFQRKSRRAAKAIGPN
jgi:hypothetical protein